MSRARVEGICSHLDPDFSQGSLTIAGHAIPIVDLPFVLQDWDIGGNWIIPQGFGDQAPAALAPAQPAQASAQAPAEDEDDERLCVVRLLLYTLSPTWLL